MRRLGHNMEKKVSLWWDTSTFETYLKESLVPRRLRWDVPLNDGLTDQESNEEWFKFFNDKGLELLRFLLERKQRKIKIIDQNITQLKEELEVYKETTEFKTLTTQLNKDLIKKDKEVQQRKSKKYTRDLKDFRNDQVFKWKSLLGRGDNASTYSTPEKMVRVDPHQTGEPSNTQTRSYQDPREGHIVTTPRYQDSDGRNTYYQPSTPYRGDRRPQSNRTPQNGGRKPYWKNNRKPHNNWHKPPYDQREYRGPPQGPRDQRRPVYEDKENREPP